MLEEKGFRGGGLNFEEANGQEQKPVRVLFVSDSRFWGFSRLSLSSVLRSCAEYRREYRSLCGFLLKFYIPSTYLPFSKSFFGSEIKRGKRLRFFKGVHIRKN